MKVLVVSNQHPHEKYADFVRSYVEKNITQDKNRVPNLQFYRIPDEKYNANLTSLSNTLLNNGICTRITKSNNFSTKEKHEIKKLISWTKNKIADNIYGSMTIDTEIY